MPSRTSLALAAALVTTVASAARGATLKCSPDSVLVGGVCVDKYEASVWQIPAANKALVKKVQQGKATLADMQKAGSGAVQLGCTAAPFGLTAYPGSFPTDGNWTPLPDVVPPTAGVYAASIPGVLPSTCISWFQANQACLLAGKRLLTNREWQGAAAGTPDPGSDDQTSDCVVSSSAPVLAGSRSSCKSSWGVFDMVGNVVEWVADWSDLAVNCTDWTSQTGVLGTDQSCFGGPGNYDPMNNDMPGNSIPGAVFRGGAWADGPNAGVFMVLSVAAPSHAQDYIGFRCGR